MFTDYRHTPQGRTTKEEEKREKRKMNSFVFIFWGGVMAGWGGKFKFSSVQGICDGGAAVAAAATVVEVSATRK